MAEAAAKRKGQDTEEAATASETDLLIEIRDLLASQSGVSTPSNDIPEGESPETGRHSAE